MPPWSGRLLSPSSRNEPGQASANIVSPARMRVTESEILENAFSIPSLTPSGQSNHDASNYSKPIQNPSHGRSMSHPFPSLFSGKKRQGESAAVSGFDSTDDDLISPVAVRNAAYNTNTPKQKVPDKDLKTGRCMTCDSMVRWPKDLKVFRCTVCLTINDLQPATLDTRSGEGQRGTTLLKSIKPSGAKCDPKAGPLSIEKTKKLIDQCITVYLLGRLKHDDQSSSSPTPSPPLSPTWKGKGIGPPLEPSDLSQTQGLQSGQSPSRQIPPRHLSPRKSRLADKSSDPLVTHNLRQTNPSPYSRSSPGNFYGAHMEQRGRQPVSDSANEAAAFGNNDYFEEWDSEERKQRNRENAAGNIFKPLQEYIVASFGSFECINTSFSTLRPTLGQKAASEGSRHIVPTPSADRIVRSETQISQMDAKTLLLGDFAENGFWWTGERSSVRSPERPRHRSNGGLRGLDMVNLKTPRIDWTEANEWYSMVTNAGNKWREKWDKLTISEQQKLSDQELGQIAEQILEAQSHTQRVLLKATESLLKRPGRPLTEPSDLRFLLLILINPLLYPNRVSPGPKSRESSKSRSRSRDPRAHLRSGSLNGPPRGAAGSPRLDDAKRGSSGQHSGIIKRILGLLANVSNECHHHLVSWFARYPDEQFQRTTDLIGRFVTYRLTRQHGKKREIDQDPTSDLIPSIVGSGRNTSAALHAALGVVNPQTKKNGDSKPRPVLYNDDWQIKAAARVMALFFSANNSGLSRRGDSRPLTALEGSHSASPAARERAQNHGQILPTSDFYNTLLDYSDLIADFEHWESRKSKFAFCQYPFFLSIWAKIQIMEHDARRQMEVKAREAFFDSIMTRKQVNQYLVLKVRRECLVEDSLKGVSEVVGTGGEEIKKGLRIEFKGEEGIDAGGLRKEWFLLLVREVFNPEHGLFTYDEDSRFCYFNPNTFETTDQFFLVGVVLGLAIYNSTILDVALPPFAFRKLLAAGPPAAPGATSHAKPSMTYSLEDLAEYRPALANGLKQLLEFEGDVESTFCRDFVADVERYGQMIQIPLCPGGENRPVTNANRREFVDLYVRYLLDAAVTRQFEPFKRGFFTVCGGNALSLFRPEEIELLIRGSDEPLDIASLRAVSICENWGVPNAADTEPVIQWFWESFLNAKPKDQRKLLSFITGSDRIPAMGATNLVIKLSCLGDDGMRFPVARTCFNMLSLWRYSSRQKLESMLWRAVNESEGFGLK